MKKKSSNRFYVILIAAFLGMGMSMPSCPGQQAMQQQIDTLTTQNADLTKKLQGADSQIKTLNADMTQVKTLLKPMADAIQAQKTAMDQLNANLTELQAKLTKPAAAGTKKRK